MRKKKVRIIQGTFCIACLLFISGYLGYRANQPVRRGAKNHYYRVDQAQSLASILTKFESDGVLRSAKWTSFLASLRGTPKMVEKGTYLIGPGESGSTILTRLQHKIIIKFRIPSTNWAARTARLLQKHSICSANDYLAAVHNPSEFQKYVDFPLPKNSLEGFLYPDTYNLEPFSSAHDLVERQLKTFQKKVYDPLGKPVNISKFVTIGSLIELEVDRDSERQLVSAVIYNRLKKNMRLQIDASLNYAIGIWRPLKLSDLKKIPGPYNLYTHSGLPPSPICSPTVKSIRAAMTPAPVSYLYYVALPSGRTLFASTFAEHKKNILLRKKALEAIKLQRSSQTRGT